MQKQGRAAFYTKNSRAPHHHNAFFVTYATQQLTHALQELTSRSQQVEVQPRQTMPRVITAQQLHFSPEVENYLEQKQAYAQRTRSVSVGTY